MYTGTATSGADYPALSGTMTIPAGQTSATINVPVIDDAASEGTETVLVTLTTLAGDPQITSDNNAKVATLDILDSDGVLVIIATTTAGNEAGPVNGKFTVSQSAALPTNTVIALTIGGSATAGSDYTALSDQAYTDLIANPIAHVNSGLLQTAAVPSAGEIAFYDRVTTNSLYNDAGGRVVRVDITDNVFSPGSNR